MWYQKRPEWETDDASQGTLAAVAVKFLLDTQSNFNVHYL